MRLELDQNSRAAPGGGKGISSRILRKAWGRGAGLDLTAFSPSLLPNS